LVSLLASAFLWILQTVRRGVAPGRTAIRGLTGRIGAETG